MLSLTRATAQRLHVGKRGYRPSCRRQYIQWLMIGCVRRGLAVGDGADTPAAIANLNGVRLKSPIREPQERRALS